MTKIVKLIIIILFLVIVGESIVFLAWFDKKGSLTSDDTTTFASTPTQPLYNPQLNYMPTRNYSGSFISLDPGTGGYKYILVYQNVDSNTQEKIFIGPQETEMASVQYFDSANELTDEVKGLEFNSLQPQDKFDIIVSDHNREDTPANNQSNNYKVDQILIKVYR